MPSEKWLQCTPYLLYCCLSFMSGAVLFGVDTGSFGSLQALPSFLDRFGVETIKAGKTTHVLPATRKSLMNSLPWIGKFSGCFGAEPLIERFGYRKTAYIAAAIQIVAVIIELTAHSWGQFTAGRIIAYFAVGLVENVTPNYNAEIAPAALRGFLAGSLIMFTSLGNLWGAGMSRAYASETAAKGWIIPTSMQLIPALLLLVLIPFTPESPRWLLLKNRRDEAQAAMNKIRPRREVENGTTAIEVEAIEQLVKASSVEQTASWLDLFRGNYLRRTWITASLFIFEQTNGNQFVQSYGATFYVQQGLGAKSFTYNTIGQVVGVVGCAFGIIIFDYVGRRPAFIGGAAILTLLLYVAAGLGLDKKPSSSAQNMIIASFILAPAFTRISASNCAFLTGAEIGGLRMRKKTMAFGTAIDVAAAFVVTFVTPYILPTLGVNIGWIFGSVAALCIVWGYLFFPELKGRSLEEVDELFNADLWAWQFARYKTTGVGSYLTALETHRVEEDVKIPNVEHLEGKDDFRER